MQNVSPVLLKVDNESITPADTICNLGVIFDAQMTMGQRKHSILTTKFKRVLFSTLLGLFCVF